MNALADTPASRNCRMFDMELVRSRRDSDNPFLDTRSGQVPAVASEAEGLVAIPGPDPTRSQQRSLGLAAVADVLHSGGSFPEQKLKHHGLQPSGGV